MGRLAYPGMPQTGEIRSGLLTEDLGTGSNERNEMSAAELDLHVETESERIARWRAEELERAGYGSDDAVELASRAYVDLHLAVELIERGCPAATAVRILL